MGRRRTFTERKGLTKTLALGAGLLVAGTALATAGGSPFGGQETRGQQVTQRGDVIISELMVEGNGGTGQFIELHNTTGSNIDIKNWVLKGNRTISITILRSVVIPAGGDVVLGPDRRTGSGIPLDYAYSQTLYLSQSGPYTLQLQQGSTVIDTVTYDPATWPISAGASMQLDPDFLTSTANDSLDNWCASSSPIPNFEPILGTPGEPNDLCNEGAPDNDGDGFSTIDGDCDDNDASVHPGAEELCDGLDNDCNDLVDDGATTLYYADRDKDGYGDAGSSVDACSPPAGYVSNSSDCNDNDATVKPGAAEACDGIDNNCNSQIDEGLARTRYYADLDGDTYGDSSNFVDACVAPFGYVTRGGDCNDGNPAVNPGATEKCDTIDNDCDGAVDEGVTNTYYVDNDLDTYGSSTTVQACSQPNGTATRSGDCDDNANGVNPGAAESCNGKDDNCNGAIDDGVTTQTFYADKDKDGFGDPASTTTACSAPTGYVSNNTDCNDNNPSVKPGATETCNGIDDNCSGAIDEGVQNTYYQDADGDTYGNPNKTAQGCTAPTGYVSNKTDCDDTSATVNPGATELCNSKDDNCNGLVDDNVGSTTYYQDADGDTFGNPAVRTTACAAPTGYVTNNKDCNDASASVNPNATEVCNGVDDNCSGSIDEGVKTNFYVDGDKDGFGKAGSTPTAACTAPTGYVNNNSDCDDASASVNPAAVEQCNSVDDNCNGQIDEGVTNTTWYQDADGDGYGNAAVTKSACAKPAGYVSNSTDCNDADATIKPGATETCNSKDDNCNGSVDEGVGTTYYQDNDADGYGSTTTTVACTKPTGYATVGGDCNDASATVKPGATELCNGVDDNCNGTIDDGVTNSTWYQDSDGDGYGNAAVTKSACSQPAGYVSNSTDCNDTNSAVKPGATETCNGIDDNCSGAIDEGVKTTYYQDNDADGYGSTTTTQACTKPTGYATVGGDCNDASATVKPGATELCNGVDDNCNGTIDDGVTNSTWYQDS
ncbi:MAG: MopE-related protein, partial [Myxococcota bacterium]